MPDSGDGGIASFRAGKSRQDGYCHGAGCGSAGGHQPPGGFRNCGNPELFADPRARARGSDGQQRQRGDRVGKSQLFYSGLRGSTFTNNANRSISPSSNSAGNNVSALAVPAAAAQRQASKKSSPLSRRQVNAAVKESPEPIGFSA